MDSLFQKRNDRGEIVRGEEAIRFTNTRNDTDRLSMMKPTVQDLFVDCPFTDKTR